MNNQPPLFSKESEKKTFFLILLMVFIGLITGASSGALGIGGGVILVPALTLWLKMNMRESIGLSLSMIVPISFIGIFTHYQINPVNLNWTFAAILTVGTLPGAYIGKKINYRITGQALNKLFALVLTFVALRMSFSSLPISNNLATPISISMNYLPIIGLLTGIFSALFGIGGGIIIVPTLDQLYNLPIIMATATSLIVTIPTTALGSYLYNREYKIDYKKMSIILSSAVLGSVLGVWLATQSPPMLIRQIFSIILIYSAWKITRQNRKILGISNERLY